MIIIIGRELFTLIELSDFDDIPETKTEEEFREWYNIHT